MTIDEAASYLAEMYEKASEKEKALSVHLFGIKYADQIRDISSQDIAIRAGLKRSYATEIRKGINLARYVEVKG